MQDRWISFLIEMKNDRNEPLTFRLPGEEPLPEGLSVTVNVGKETYEKFSAGLRENPFEGEVHFLSDTSLFPFAMKDTSGNKITLVPCDEVFVLFGPPVNATHNGKIRLSKHSFLDITVPARSKFRLHFGTTFDVPY